MLDRNGKLVRVGWAKHEILWLMAANSLPHPKRIAALHDISDLTGRGYKSVQRRANRLKAVTKQEPAPVARIVLVPVSRPLGRPKQAISYNYFPASDLRQPTKQQLMGCR